MRRPTARTGIRVVLEAGILGAILVAAWTGVNRLDARVDAALLADRPDATISFVNLPPIVAELAADSLDRTVSNFLARSWTDARLCRDIADAVASNPWVERVDFVRRDPEPRFTVSCRYRVPAAQVQAAAEFLLVDADGVRLPGAYRYDPSQLLIQGVAARPPAAGTTWPGGDVQAGLAVLAAIANEPFRPQITAVVVDNFDGRVDRVASHLVLATDRAGGRIEWGSAPGSELEENTPQQKIAILRENFRRTGRIDAGHLGIDVSTYPDRFRISG